MYSGNVSPCIEFPLTRDFKGEKTPLHVIIYKTYVVVTPLSIEPLPDVEKTKKEKVKLSSGQSKIEVNPDVPIGQISGGNKASTGNLH